jgi:hypothetical protein
MRSRMTARTFVALAGRAWPIVTRISEVRATASTSLVTRYGIKHEDCERQHQDGTGDDKDVLDWSSKLREADAFSNILNQPLQITSPNA